MSDGVEGQRRVAHSVEVALLDFAEDIEGVGFQTPGRVIHAVGEEGPGSREDHIDTSYHLQ